MSNQFSSTSIELTKKIPKATKQKEGIFFTPKIIIKNLLYSVFMLCEHFERILEPSCGSCEIVTELCDRLIDAKIDCIEYNSIIYDYIKDLVFENNNVFIYNKNFLKYRPDNGNEYDLIVGNPPFVVCKKDDVPSEYSEYISGRPNMFGLFILHSLSMLKVGGILAFVVPKSFFNSIYYSEIRNYIVSTCDIIKVEDYEEHNKFLETEQATFGLILRRTSVAPNKERLLEESIGQYAVRINGGFIFTDDAIKLKSYFIGATTLRDMGITVKTGTVVWNEKKDLLTNSEDETVLLYNTNVTNNNTINLTNFKNNEKKQYITAEGMTEPIIVVNRGNGNAAYNFKYALVHNINNPYLVENHLNMVIPPANLKNNDKLILLQNVMDSFKSDKTKEFIKLFFGNNGLSKTELETVLPIYL